MASPASSPRLPSPPPMAEDQVSPSASLDSEHGKLGLSQQHADEDAARRIRPGTRAEDMQEGPPLVELQQIDSAFQLTEHLKAMHNSHTQSCSIALDKSTAQSLAQPPPGVERGIWLYELCRFLTQKANMMAVGLFADDPPCSATTCPEMRASEWQYLCAAHEPPKSCCAIDYCCHTLDWCATALTSTKLFPSRLNLGTESVSAQIQIRKMTEVFRRVYRIFAHAWFSHRDVFWKIESKTGLYLLFKSVCDEYRLIPEDNYTIPPEAEGIENTPTAPNHQAPAILQRDASEGEPVGNSTLATGNTTKRHRHTMSDRSVSVSTIIHEEIEEEDDGEQPTTDLYSAPAELTRVETARQDDQLHEPEQELDIPAEDPPPYPETELSEDKSQEVQLDQPETPEIVVSAEPESPVEAEPETEEAPTTESEPPAETDLEPSEKKDEEPETSTSTEGTTSTESPADATTETEAAGTAADTLASEEEPEETPEETTTTSEAAAEEAEVQPEEPVTEEDEEKDKPETMDPSESAAADETEAPKTVAD